MSVVEQVYNEELDAFVDEFMVPVIERVNMGELVIGMDGTRHSIDTVFVIASNGEYTVAIEWVSSPYPVVIDNDGNLVADKPMISGEVVAYWRVGGAICLV